MDAIIEERRALIDALDDELVRLLNRRAQLAVEVGGLKRRDATPMRDSERERQVLTRIRRANTGPFNDDAMTRIFQCIIDESRSMEESIAQTSPEQTVRPQIPKVPELASEIDYSKA
ncbi:MAG TPA: chorismate mutase [Pyrinomonadaceae bacterium]|nr:chorismate mutase [Pyrinomonadaceae bacterium]